MMEEKTPSWVKSMPKWGMWKEKETMVMQMKTCCGLTTSEQRQECLDNIREDKNNKFCQKLETSVEEGMSKIEQVFYRQPSHPCCQVEDVQRSDCFDQEELEYSPYKHSQ